MKREKQKNFSCRIKESVKENFRFATLDMIFILVFVNVFQMIFGAENSIVGVIFTILMASSMVRDFTATPIKHLILQAFTLVGMALCAFFVTTLSPLVALPINLIAIFVILYAFTYEYATHMYFPYILSYLFLIFIGPITTEQLPKRLLAMLTGAVCVILYQLFMGRCRVKNITQEVMNNLLEDVQNTVQSLLSGKGVTTTPETVRKRLCQLSKVIYDRRKKVLQVSDASFCMLDVGRGLENLSLQLNQMQGEITLSQVTFLQKLQEWLSNCKAFINSETAEVPPFQQKEGQNNTDDPTLARIVNILEYIRTHLLQMKEPEKRRRYRKTALSFFFRLKAAMDISAVRICYAGRVAVVLALCTTLVQLGQLPHGKWLLFTIASVSLPYADDVKAKAFKRMLATVVGGLVAFILFTCVPSTTGRMIIMILSGYLSFYFSDYTGTFACSTVGALGGAVFLTALSWETVGNILLIRLFYVAMGVIIALIVNCAIVPFTRRMATYFLLRKYANTCKLLKEICEMDNPDIQLYYSLVVQAHLQEEQLSGNALKDGREEMVQMLRKCQEQVRAAHRRQTASAR